MTGARERSRSDQRFSANAAYGPRVYMPPLDLGFRGQTATGEEKSSKSNSLGNAAFNYQSDESAANRWDAERYGYNDQRMPQPQPEQPYAQTNMEPNPSPYTYVNSYPPTQWAPVREYEPNPYPLQYLHSRGPPAQRLVQYVAPTGPGGYAPQPPMMANNNPYQPPYAMSYDGNRPLPPIQNTPNTNPYTGYGQPSWYNVYNQPAQPAQTPYYPYNNMAVYSRPKAAESEPRTPTHKSTTLLGHASNYEVISDEEIERRLKDYNAYLQKHRGDKGPRKDPTKKSEPHDNGLRLKGSESHEKIVKDFKKLATKVSLDGVDTLFDEIDLDKDGVIKLEEFRTFLWFHEIGVAN